MESRIQRATRFSKIWWKSRADSGKSQEYMAMGLGVSKKTIQNWEKGITSPDLFQGSEWFRLLGLNPLHYYLEFLYPEAFASDADEDDDKRTEAVLISLIKQNTPMEKRQLLYLISGNHGSSWYALLQMFTAHCHTSMQSRAAAASLVAGNYEVERDNCKLICPDDIQPDMQVLKDAVLQGQNAARNNDKGYASYPL
ncbi:MAG: helix-turn-helix transcriptional regulator [Oscillospiraceae bacterium]